MTEQQTQISPSLVKALGLNEMTEEEQADFFETLGQIAVESALLRYSVSLSNTEREAFRGWVESQDDLEVLLKESADTYPEFAEILDEEVTAMHDSIVKMVG